MDLKVFKEAADLMNLKTKCKGYFGTKYVMHFHYKIHIYFLLFFFTGRRCSFINARSYGQGTLYLSFQKTKWFRCEKGLRHIVEDTCFPKVTTLP